MLAPDHPDIVPPMDDPTNPATNTAANPAAPPELRTDLTETDLRDRLSAEQFIVTQQAGTEPAFTGAFWDKKDAGIYRCVVCEMPLFSSDTKYESGSGWPSFFEALDPEKVTLIEDRSHGMSRTEAVCAHCGAHLGHVFQDGPRPTGQRFCMNSASLDFLAE